MIQHQYYATGHTSIGFYTLWPKLYTELDKVYLLQGHVGMGKSTLIKETVEELEKQGADIHRFYNPSDPEHLEGFIIPHKRLGMIDETILGNAASISNTHLIHFNDFLNPTKYKQYTTHIEQAAEQLNTQYNNTYHMFGQAKELHKQKENLYLSATDFSKADQVAADLQQTLFSTDKNKSRQASTMKWRFFGAATPDGAQNYIDNITHNIRKRYIIKGRSGSGKSTVINKIGKQAQSIGLDVYYFPCALDPHSLDMILIPELSTAVLDGTAPHVIDPSRTGDEVIDMFELCIDPHIEVDRKEDIEHLQKQYKQHMQQGTTHLKEALNIYRGLKYVYKEIMDHKSLDEKREEIIDSMMNF